MAGLNSILIFLIAAAPIKTVDLAGEAGGTFTGMDTMALDAKGGVCSHYCSADQRTIDTFFEKASSGYQDAGCGSEFLQDTFRSLIPLVVNAIIWTVLGYGCVALTQTASGIWLPVFWECRWQH